jgi:hypothetical protein
MRIVRKAIMACVVGVVMCPAILASQEPARSTPKSSQLTKAQFDAMRDDESIEVRGRTMTKREVVAMIARNRTEAEARAAVADKEAEAKLRTENENFERSERERIDKENAQTRAEAPGAPPEDASSRAAAQVRAEAVQLRARAAKATSDAELAEIHKRAQQLLDQLRRQ